MLQLVFSLVQNKRYHDCRDHGEGKCYHETKVEIITGVLSLREYIEDWERRIDGVEDDVWVVIGYFKHGFVHKLRIKRG